MAIFFPNLTWENGWFSIIMLLFLQQVTSGDAFLQLETQNDRWKDLIGLPTLANQLNINCNLKNKENKWYFVHKSTSSQRPNFLWNLRFIAHMEGQTQKYSAVLMSANEEIPHWLWFMTQQWDKTQFAFMWKYLWTTPWVLVRAIWTLSKNR